MDGSAPAANSREVASTMARRVRRRCATRPAPASLVRPGWAVISTIRTSGLDDVPGTSLLYTQAFNALLCNYCSHMQLVGRIRWLWCSSTCSRSRRAGTRPSGPCGGRSTSTWRDSPVTRITGCTGHWRMTRGTGTSTWRSGNPPRRGGPHMTRASGSSSRNPNGTSSRARLACTKSCTPATTPRRPRADRAGGADMTSLPAGVDTRDMLLIHRVIRREISRLPGLIRGTGDPSRAAQIASHASEMLDFLHTHHCGEDELLWPLLRPRVRLEDDLIDRMEAQHGEIAAAVDDVRRWLPGWAASADAATGERIAARLES